MSRSRIALSFVLRNSRQRPFRSSATGGEYVVLRSFLSLSPLSGPERADAEADEPERDHARGDRDDPVRRPAPGRGAGREGTTREDRGEQKEERAERLALLMTGHDLTVSLAASTLAGQPRGVAQW